MKRIRQIRKLCEPLRPLHGAAFEMVCDDIRFAVTREAYSSRYAGGTFEIAGRRFRIVVLPAEVELAIINRKEVRAGRTGDADPDGDRASRAAGHDDGLQPGITEICLAVAGQSGDSAAREGAGEEKGALPQITTKGDE
jgi:hypothetical protein